MPRRLIAGRVGHDNLRACHKSHGAEREREEELVHETRVWETIIAPPARALPQRRPKLSRSRICHFRCSISMFVVAKVVKIPLGHAERRFFFIFLFATCVKNCNFAHIWSGTASRLQATA
jgi:hypothetical protein